MNHSYFRFPTASFVIKRKVHTAPHLIFPLVVLMGGNETLANDMEWFEICFLGALDILGKILTSPEVKVSLQQSSSQMS